MSTAVKERPILKDAIQHYVFANTIGQCWGCRERTGRMRRQNTAYVNDLDNWACLCTECQEEANEYWAERWADYYGNVW